jgi:hypothetical protein
MTCSFVGAGSPLNQQQTSFTQSPLQQQPNPSSSNDIKEDFNLDFLDNCVPQTNNHIPSPQVGANMGNDLLENIFN